MPRHRFAPGTTIAGFGHRRSSRAARAIPVIALLLGTPFVPLGSARCDTTAVDRGEAVTSPSTPVGPSLASGMVARVPAADSIGRALTTIPGDSSLALLRSRVGRRAVHVWVGEEGYEIVEARFDSTGVVFPPGRLRGLPRPAGGDAEPLTSPIAWDRIGRIQARHAHVLAAAVAGGLVGTLGVIAATRQSDDAGPGIIAFAIAQPIAGGLVGALIGMAIGRWPTVWERAPARSATR